MSSDSEDEMLAICGAACAAAALLVNDEVSGMPCLLLSYLDDDVETVHPILYKEVELFSRYNNNCYWLL